MNIISKYPNKDKNKYRKGVGYYIPLVIALAGFLTGFITIAYLITTLPYYFSDTPEIKGEPIKQEFVIPQTKAQEEKPEPVVHLTDDDIIAMVVMSEAGNQDMLGKVAVATTVLNRADYYGMTVEQVVSAPNQYSYPYNGIITADCYRAVEIARVCRDLFPSTMMWFRTGSYHNIGEPYNPIGDHYFSYLKEE